MKKTLILLAGYPATGKSYLCSQICSKHPEFRILSQDELKEGLWDQYGFDGSGDGSGRTDYFRLSLQQKANGKDLCTGRKKPLSGRYVSACGGY